jgi:phosphatidylserine decarboxylase
MRWDLLLLGGALGVALGQIVAARWKLPTLLSLTGVVLAALLAMLPMLWVYPRLAPGWPLAAALLAQVVLSLAVAFAMSMFYFWRDPERTPPEEEDVVLSAADGQVLFIKSVDAQTIPLVTKNGRDYHLDELTGDQLAREPAVVIGIEMNLLDVHVNRCPIDGRIVMTKHIGGHFISLRRPEAPFVNERVTTVIRNSEITVAVVQVASRLVRRIESYLAPGQTVSLGERLGRIRFGSLVAVVLPQSERLLIEAKPGDQVTAGVSVLARLKPLGEEDHP